MDLGASNSEFNQVLKESLEIKSDIPLNALESMNTAYDAFHTASKLLEPATDQEMKLSEDPQSASVAPKPTPTPPPSPSPAGNSQNSLKQEPATGSRPEAGRKP